MLCSGNKTKLLIVCTKETRESKINSVGKQFRAEVCVKLIEETSDEKLLGIIMGRNMTWNTHLYGNKKTGKNKIQGLVPQLSQWVGFIAQLSKGITNILLKTT
jgi:hypothetical protein